MTSTTLAQRLNDLAAANDQGLLSDDEYRLLRQNLFERYSTAVIVPVEAPLVPIAKPSPHKPPPTRKSTLTSSKSAIISPSSSTHIGTPTPSLHSSSTSNSRSKPTVVTVTNLLRRATGRKVSASASTSSLSTSRNSSVQSHFQNALTPNRGNPSARDHSPLDSIGSSYSSSLSTPNVGAGSRPGTPSKRSVLPRLLHRKASELGFARSSSPGIKDQSIHQPSSRSTTHDHHTTSISPTSSNNAQRHHQNLSSLSSPARLSVRRPGLPTNDSFSSTSPTTISASSSFNASRTALLSTSPPNLTTLSNIQHPLASKSDLGSLTSLTSPISSTSLSIIEAPDTSSTTIRQILIAAEADLGRVLEEFTSLELNVLQKLAQARARRLPAPTPKNANVLIEGREWRDHSPAQLTIPAVGGPGSNLGTSVSSSRQSTAGVPKPGQKQKPKSLASVHLSGTKSAKDTEARTSTGRASTTSGSGSIDDIAPSSPSAESSARTSVSLGQAQSHSQLHLSPSPSSPRSPSLSTPSTAQGSSGFPISTPSTLSPAQSQFHGQPPTSATTKSSSSLSTASQDPSSLSLRRKGSISSVSSYGPSVYGAKLSKSTSHLPLSVVAERESIAKGSTPSLNLCTCPGAGPSLSNTGRLKLSNSSGALASPSTCPLHIPEIPSEMVMLFSGLGLSEEQGLGIWLDHEVVAVRRRKEEVRRRYDERMEYLRVKMKGAELREKLMRK
ncbi:hypothetical protein BDN72DRAFT_893323 [Pluteus cervinus]|uniref:Uncharacterized protein n=1 Tax=Pluteus cervinus TaxID=181527 RepID=A0ACD3BAR6_9AGAR|nr:hypothetical protein BDN72DRAFT_893323 [Pluteus cervinus]